jgi:hypothetical protein
MTTRKKRSEGRLLVRVGVRTAHIACASFVLVGASWSLDPGLWGAATLATGGWLAIDDLDRHGLDWPRYAQGAAILAKLALLAVGLAAPGVWLVAVWGAFAVGGFISHAPGWIRQAPLWGEAGACATRCERPDESTVATSPRDA